MTYSERTKGEIAIHPNAIKIFSPMGYFILFPLFLFRLDTLRREERDEVGYGALVVV